MTDMIDVFNVVTTNNFQTISFLLVMFLAFLYYVKKERLVMDDEISISKVGLPKRNLIKEVLQKVI